MLVVLPSTIHATELFLERVWGNTTMFKMCYHVFLSLLKKNGDPCLCDQHDVTSFAEATPVKNLLVNDADVTYLE